MNDIFDIEAVKNLIALAVEEDLGCGDITSTLTVSDQLRGTTELIAKESGIVCGLGVCAAVYRELPGEVEINCQVKDGDSVESGAVLAKLSGPVRTLLGGERIILNFLQRLSGIATFTAAAVAELHTLKVYDTRKTTPGWRMLEKYAVRAGGGTNHRMHLGDMIMIKDNHADLAGKDLGDLVQSVLAEKPSTVPIEVEVRTLEDIKKIAGLQVDAIMLDNMDNRAVEGCLQYINSHWEVVPRVEVSGGITVERLKKLEALGVPSASMGALTTSAHSLDISMLAAVAL